MATTRTPRRTHESDTAMEPATPAGAARNGAADLSARQRREIGRALVAEYRETLEILAAHDRDESGEPTDHRNDG